MKKLRHLAFTVSASSMNRGSKTRESNIDSGDMEARACKLDSKRQADIAGTDECRQMLPVLNPD